MSAFERLPLRQKLIAGGIAVLPMLLWGLFLLLAVPADAGPEHCSRDSRWRAERQGERIVCGGWPIAYQFGHVAALFTGMGAGALYVRLRTRRANEAGSADDRDT